MAVVAGVEQDNNLETGTFTATGPGIPRRVKGDFNLSLWGTFAATVILERSFDDGATFLPVCYSDGSSSSYTAPMSTSWSEKEAGVLYRFNCTSYTSGTVNWRLSQ